MFLTVKSLGNHVSYTIIQHEAQCHEYCECQQEGVEACSRDIRTDTDDRTGSTDADGIKRNIQVLAKHQLTDEPFRKAHRPILSDGGNPCC